MLQLTDACADLRDTCDDLSLWDEEGLRDELTEVWRRVCECRECECRECECRECECLE